MRVVAADWSGAAAGEQRHLWLAETGGEDPPRVERLAGMTRAAVADRLVALADRDPALVVGLDFCFSLPAWYLAETAIGSAPDLWQDTARLEGWLADCRPPFWGRPGRARPRLAPDRHWRRTELAATPRPKSAFQIGGAGAVGTASLRGMPVLHRLRQAGFSVWPMDPPRPPVAFEVWPRLHTAPFVKSRPEARWAWLASRRASVAPGLRPLVGGSPDAFDATAAALALAGAFAAGVSTVTELPTIDDPQLRLEGWIWGIDGWASSTGPAGSG